MKALDEVVLEIQKLRDEFEGKYKLDARVEYLESEVKKLNAERTKIWLAFIGGITTAIGGWIAIVVAYLTSKKP